MSHNGGGEKDHKKDHSISRAGCVIGTSMTMRVAKDQKIAGIPLRSFAASNE